MKPSIVLRLTLLVSCLETVRGTPVDQKEKLFALVRIKPASLFLNNSGNTAKRYEKVNFTVSIRGLNTEI